MPDTLNFSRLKWTKLTVIQWPTNKKLLPKLNVLLNFLIKTMMGIWVVSRKKFTKKEISPLIVTKKCLQNWKDDSEAMQNQGTIRGSVDEFWTIDLWITGSACSKYTKAVTYNEQPKMKRGTQQKSSTFVRKKTAFLSGTSLHIRPFVKQYSFSYIWISMPNLAMKKKLKAK